MAYVALMQYDGIDTIIGKIKFSCLKFYLKYTPSMHSQNMSSHIITMPFEKAKK